MWYIFCCCLLQPAWPHGTYKAIVRLPLLATQEIAITTRRKHEAEIVLTGAINMREPFRYDRLGAHWDVHFGKMLQKTLDRFHCRLEGIDFDGDRDVASVWLTMPLLGERKIILRKSRHDPNARLPPINQ